MFAEYILAARDLATYEIIDDPEPFYGQASGPLGNRQDPWRNAKGSSQEVIEG